LEVTSFTYII